jgi:hypothetical protein
MINAQQLLGVLVTMALLAALMSQMQRKKLCKDAK